MNAPGALSCVDEWLDGALVVKVALRGATALNLVDEPLLRQAARELEALLARPGLRCVLFGGASPRAFIGGANLHALAALDLESAASFIRSIHEFAMLLRCAAVPVVAVMRGYCLGAGLEIAAACDFRIGDDSVRCGMPEVRIGVPSVVEAALLPNLVGWGKAREMMLRGHIIEADEAGRIGLLQHVTAAADLLPLAATIVRDLIAGAPGALAAQKRLFRRWEDSTMTAAIDVGIDAFVEAYAGDEPMRAIADFFARRPRR